MLMSVCMRACVRAPVCVCVCVCWLETDARCHLDTGSFLGSGRLGSQSLRAPPSQDWDCRHADTLEIYVSVEDLNSGLHAFMASSLPARPSSQPSGPSVCFIVSSVVVPWWFCGYCGLV